MRKLIVVIISLALIACAPQKGDQGDAGNAIVGPSGPKGDTGEIGIPGNDGATGPKGDDAIATIVQLCPGVTAYPGIFVEIAFCINHKLYGVYSTNGGFMTYFPEGAYTSHGIGSACNLRVKANCAVEPL